MNRKKKQWSAVSGSAELCYILDMRSVFAFCFWKKTLKPLCVRVFFSAWMGWVVNRLARLLFRLKMCLQIVEVCPRQTDAFISNKSLFCFVLAHLVVTSIRNHFYCPVWTLDPSFACRYQLISFTCISIQRRTVIQDDLIIFSFSKSR